MGGRGGFLLMENACKEPKLECVSSERAYDAVLYAHVGRGGP